MSEVSTRQISRLGSPLRLFVTLMLAIFSIEFIVMFILPMVLADSGRFAENLADSFLLTLLCAPVIWHLIVQPLRNAAIKLAKGSKQLLEAQEELVRSEKLAMIGQLAGSVGNELRNPLGVMNNAVYFLKSVLPDADETVKEYLDIIDAEISASRRIIADFHDSVRTRPPRMTETNLPELIRQCLQGCVIPENIQLQTDLPAGLSPVEVDPNQMQQASRNLITNAVQAMPAGGILRIQARQVRGTGNGDTDTNVGPRSSNIYPDLIEISVSDTGIGITPENMEKLFQPLFTTKSRGVGMGLYIANNLTIANGGRIGVESLPGQGTTFTVIVPVKEE